MKRTYGEIKIIFKYNHSPAARASTRPDSTFNWRTHLVIYTCGSGRLAAVSEHREAFLTPLGGGTITHSLIRPAHLAPCHDIRYSRCLPENWLVRPIRERIWWATRVGAVCWPVFEHRAAVPTPLGGGTIAHSPIRTAHLAPCHDIRYSRCLPEPSVMGEYVILAVLVLSHVRYPFYRAWTHCFSLLFLLLGLLLFLFY